MAICVAAGAQSMYDAIDYSQNNYYGTARSMALGNAVTAVGGDLGTIGINPAGSAVAGYGQVTITPGISVSSVSSSYSPVGESDYGYSTKQGNTRFGINNIGISFVRETGRQDGVKSVTFSFTSNRTSTFNNKFSALGYNSFTSKFAELATGANGYSPDVLNRYDSYYDSNASWDVITGYRGNLLSSYGNGNDYAGNNEIVSDDMRFHYIPGELEQFSRVEKSGSKRDIVLNWAVNVSDMLYLGFNLGLPTAKYNYAEYYSETAVNPEKFPIAFNDNGKMVSTVFQRGTTDYNYTAKYSGVYAKFGFIILPVEGLRFGASIQTPTSFTVRESWTYGATSTYADRGFNSDAASPVGEFKYRLISPYFVDAGIAYTFGGYGLLSVDYELADYSVMRFRDLESYRVGDLFYEKNEANQLFAGVSHSLRIGAEIRLTPEFSFRAGYSMVTAPEKYALVNGEQVNCDKYLANRNLYRNKLSSFNYYKDVTRGWSLGFGYSSDDSFFADFALRLNKYQDSVYMPYYDYDNYDKDGVLTGYDSPRVRNTRNLWDAALTIGWRF